MEARTLVRAFVFPANAICNLPDAPLRIAGYSPGQQ